MSDGSVDIEVKLDDSPAVSQADAVGRKIGKQVSSSVDSATSNVKKSSKEAVREIGSQMESYGAAFSKAVTLPIVAAATATGAAAVKIDTALTGVRKTVDGTEEQYRELEDAAIEFSKTNAVDPAQILDIQALGAQLGYTIDELDMFGKRYLPLLAVTLIEKLRYKAGTLRREPEPKAVQSAVRGRA